MERGHTGGAGEVLRGNIVLTKPKGGVQVLEMGGQETTVCSRCALKGKVKIYSLIQEAGEWQVWGE